MHLLRKKVFDELASSIDFTSEFLSDREIKKLTQATIDFFPKDGIYGLVVVFLSQKL